MPYASLMAKIHREDVQIGSTLDRGQGGAPFSPFSGSNYLRHAQITTVWERILAVVSL